MASAVQAQAVWRLMAALAASRVHVSVRVRVHTLTISAWTYRSLPYAQVRVCTYQTYIDSSGLIANSSPDSTIVAAVRAGVDNTYFHGALVLFTLSFLL